MPDQPESIHLIKYENINADAVCKAALKTKGGSGLLWMDADGWKRILTSRQFAESSTELCTTIANMVKKLCIDEDLANTLEAFLSCRLIPLDKNPGLRLIGVGEMLRRTVGKVIVSTLRDDIITSVGPLQVCAGQESGCETAVHAMSKMYKEEHTDAVLLGDAANAFSSVNRKVFLHNINGVCPLISIYVEDCYTLPSRLFIVGRTEIESSEGTTQGDLVAMAIYTLSVIPLMLMVLEITNTNTNSDAKMVAYADDFSAAGSVWSLKYWWGTLCELGPKFGYFLQPKKSWLIVKSDCFDKAIHVFNDTNIQIATQGRRHLGARYEPI